jgi:alkylation response protein AidB-like acyl-CoA dehydrogenase
MPPQQQQNLADRGMAAGLRAMNWLASSELVERMGLRQPAQRLIYTGSRGTFRAATTAGRTFRAASRLGRPVRQSRASGGDLFDLTPSEEQQMLTESMRDFALAKLRPAAAAADAACETPAELIDEAVALGLTMIGVPEELGGAVAERSAVTSVLIIEALAQGDPGIAVACTSASGACTALSLWGDADQQATYLPEFLGDAPPAASVALFEPRPLFDPLAPATTARRDGDGFVLSGVKALVPRAAAAELTIVGAQLDGRPALFVVEAGASGLSVAPEPGMGVRAAATGRLYLEDVKLGRGALLGGGDPAIYSDAVALGRLGWCAVAAGAGRAALDYVRPYVNERTAFGEPISNRQAVAFMVANIAIELEGIRLVALRAAGRVDQGLPFAREVSLARRLVAVHGVAIGSDAVQLLGGHGYTKEHPVERWYRDLRATGMLEGGLMV